MSKVCRSEKCCLTPVDSVSSVAHVRIQVRVGLDLPPSFSPRHFLCQSTWLTLSTVCIQEDTINRAMSLPIDVAFLILSQVATKAFTFISNQLLVRSVSPEIIGVAAYLEFITNTVLFFSREAQRLAVQRAHGETDSQTRQIITNFAFLPTLLAVPTFAALYYVQRNSELYTSTIAPLAHIEWTVALVVLLVLIELLSEPLFVLKQHEMDFKTRSKVEGFALLSKCVITSIGVIYGKRLASTTDSSDGLAVLSFSVGQSAYSVSLMAGYFFYSRSLPKVAKISEKESKPYYLNRIVFSFWKLLYVQMIFKHLLTEGDTLLISYIFTASQQGVYSVVTNYGSIVARLLFSPIEELVRVSIARSFGKENANFATSYALMESILILYANLSLLIVLGGYTNGAFLLRLILGNNEKWRASSVFEHFPQYVLYIPFMAFNGVLEAFFSSASTPSQITSFSFFMSALSILILGLLYYFVEMLKMGIKGLILANMINMTLRIVYCLKFFVNFYNGKVHGGKKVVKRLMVPFAAVFAAFSIQYQVFQGYQAATYSQFSQSIILCFVCLLVMLINERDTLIHLVALSRRKEK